MIDRFTKGIELAVCDKENSNTIKRKFKKQIVANHGIPQTVMTDNASYFEGNFKKYLSQESIQVIHGKPHRHNTNGLAEKGVKEIRQIIRNFPPKSREEFKDILIDVQIALNTSEKITTKETPFFLDHMREANTSIENKLLSSPEYQEKKGKLLQLPDTGILQHPQDKILQKKINNTAKEIIIE